MNKRNKNAAMITVMVLVMSVVAVASALMLTACSKRNRVEEESSSSGEIISSSKEESSSEEEEESSSSSSDSAAGLESSSPTTTTPPQNPTWTPPASSRPSGSSVAAATDPSSSRSSSSGSSGKTQSYSKSGAYTSRETLASASIKTGDVELRNKTIKGDLTLTSNVDDTVILDHVTVKGTLKIRGGYDVYIIDSTIEEVEVDHSDGYEVSLYAEGKTRVGAVFARTGVLLDEYELDEDYSGFRSVLVKNAREDTVLVSLSSTELNTVTMDDETHLELDGSSYVTTVKANSADSIITGDGEIKTIQVNARDIRCEVPYDTAKFGSSRYEDTFDDGTGTVTSRPSGLKAARSGNTLTFSWDAFSGARSYDYKISASGQTTQSKTGVTNRNVTVEPRFLNLNSTVTLQVRARKSSGSYTDWSSITYKETKLAAPNVTDAYANNKLTFSWPKDANAASYKVSGAANTYTTSGNTCSVVINNPVKGKEYSLTVTAVGKGMTSSGSAFTFYKDSDAKTSKYTVPQDALGTLNTINITNVTDKQVMVSWNQVANAASYTVEVFSPNNTTVPIGTKTENSSATTNTTVDLSANPITVAGTYTVKVTAKPASGTQSSQITGSFYVLALSTGTSSARASYDQNTSKITFNWDAVPNATGYHYAVTTGNSRATAAMGQTGAGQTSFVLEITSPGTYTITVTPIGGSFADRNYYLAGSAPSMTASCEVPTSTPTPDPPPTPDPVKLAAPSGLKVASVGESEVTFSWNAVAGATEYRISGTGTAKDGMTVSGTSVSIPFAKPAAGVSATVSIHIAAANSTDTPSDSAAMTHTVTQLAAPAFSTDSAALSSNGTQYTITLELQNYDAANTYVVSGTGGKPTQSGTKITWSGNKAQQITVKATRSAGPNETFLPAETISKAYNVKQPAMPSTITPTDASVTLSSFTRTPGVSYEISGSSSGSGWGAATALPANSGSGNQVLTYGTDLWSMPAPSSYTVTITAQGAVDGQTIYLTHSTQASYTAPVTPPDP